MKKIFIHVGAPKAASSSLQHFFHYNKKINFLGLVRDHEDYMFSNKYNTDFQTYCRYKNNNFHKGRNIKKKLSKKKINLISEEDFLTSQFVNFKKKFERIIKIFPNCEFIVVLRDPIETIKSWHNFDLRRLENTPINIIQYLKLNDKRITIDLINYKKRINYFKKLKKNKFHIIDFNVVKKKQIIQILEKIFNTKLYIEEKNNILEKKNANVYFLKTLFKKLPWVQKLKFFLPRFFIKITKNFLLNFTLLSAYKDPINTIENKYLDKFFSKEIRYYKSLFKKKNYFTLN
jgi:hypothetical protein